MVKRSNPGFDLLPCGCIVGNAGPAFVMQPCSLLCENYLYAMKLANELGHPVIMRGDL
jgi:hypothetical protein